jgi:hypothetical protein
MHNVTSCIFLLRQCKSTNEKKLSTRLFQQITFRCKEQNKYLDASRYQQTYVSRPNESIINMSIHAYTVYLANGKPIGNRVKYSNIILLPSIDKKKGIFQVTILKLKYLFIIS